MKTHHSSGAPALIGIWLGSANYEKQLYQTLETLHKHHFGGSLLLSGPLEESHWASIYQNSRRWFTPAIAVDEAVPLQAKALFLPQQGGYLRLKGEIVARESWPLAMSEAEEAAAHAFLQALNTEPQATRRVALLLGKPEGLHPARLQPLLEAGLQVWESNGNGGLLPYDHSHPGDTVSIREMSRQLAKGSKQADLSPESPASSAEQRIQELEAQLARQQMENKQLRQQLQEQSRELSTYNDPYQGSLQAAEARLAALSERLQLATEAAQIGVWEWDLINDQLIWNPQMYQIFGIDPEEFRNSYRDWQGVVLPEDLPRTEANLQRTIEQGEDFREVFRIQYKGGIRHIQAVASLYRDVEGKPERVIGVNWDITQTKLAEEAMRLAREQAEEWARLKSDFMSNMSHEVRTPLNGVLGMAALAQIEDDPGTIKGMLSVIEESGKRLLHTLTGILELALLESENAEFDFDEINLNRLLDQGLAYWGPLGRQKGLEVRWQPPDKQYFVWGDLRMLNLVLDNLIGNALKFTSEGTITLTLEPLSQKERPDWINLHVEDTGIGIDPQKVQKIFEAFSQISGGHARTYEGTGVGLAVAKKYAHLLGGKILVKSAKGKGSCFTIRLPLRKTQ